MVRTRRDTLCFAAEYRCYSTIERFIWDGDQLLSEFRRNGANNQLEASLNSESSDGSHFQGWVRYTHAGGIDEPLAVWKLNSDGIVPHLSWRGTFEAGSDILTGALLEGGGDTPWIWPARYTDINLAPELRMPNAAPTRWLGSLIEGQVDLNGLAYRRNRYYDPSTGRFTQEDPIGLAGGLNLYGFADGDPVNFSDPFGLCARETINVRQIEDCTRWLASSSSGEKLGLVALGAGAVGLGGAVIAGTQSLVALSSLPMLSRAPDARCLGQQWECFSGCQAPLGWMRSATLLSKSMRTTRAGQLHN